MAREPPVRESGASSRRFLTRGQRPVEQEGPKGSRGGRSCLLRIRHQQLLTRSDMDRQNGSLGADTERDERDGWWGGEGERRAGWDGGGGGWGCGDGGGWG
jgi:hypothetical protein